LRRERARWAESFYARFFDRSELKAIRDKLDCLRGNPGIRRLVGEESTALTDYLNFFEFVAYLRSSKQLSGTDIEAFSLAALTACDARRSRRLHPQSRERLRIPERDTLS